MSMSDVLWAWSTSECVRTVGWGLTALSAQIEMKKCSEEKQTLHAGCSKAEPKIFAAPQTPFPQGAGRPKFNQLEMVTTKPSLVRTDARNFKLSW